MPSKRPLVGWHGHLEIGRAGRKVDSEAIGELVRCRAQCGDVGKE